MNYTKLVEKAKTKDEKAIEQLFEMTSQKGYFVALKYLKSEEDARDILQDSYVAAISKLDQLKDPSRFDKWLFQIIANKAKNYLVKNKPLLFEQLESKDGDDIQFEETIKDDRIEFQPKENSDYQELKTALRILIDELPEDQRMCLLMYYFQDLSISEIAESLELNNNTIKSRLNYARAKIKDKIEELKKQGTHLYSISPIPFLLWMLSEEEKITAVPKITSYILGSQAMQTTASIATKKGISIFGKTVSTKVITVTALCTTTILGGGIVYYNRQQPETLVPDKQAIYDSLTMTFINDTVLEYGSSFQEDMIIKNHTGKLKPYQEIDTKKIGKETLTFILTKDGVERKFECIVEIKDTKKPTLNLTQDQVVISLNEDFNPTSYIKEAYDEIDGDLLDQVKITNPVKNDIPNEYQVSYVLKDKNGLNTEKVLKVTVAKAEVTPSQPVTNNPQVESTKEVVRLDRLGLQMKIPTPNSIRFNVGSGEQVFYDLKDYNYGVKGCVVNIFYMDLGPDSNSYEYRDEMLLRNVETFRAKGFEAYDRDDYIVGIHRGQGESPNEVDIMCIHVESKDGVGMYLIKIHAASHENGANMGNDEHVEKRVQVARDIFNSIK